MIQLKKRFHRMIFNDLIDRDRIGKDFIGENLVLFVCSSANITDSTKSSNATLRRGSSILINDDTRLQAYGWSLSSKNQLKLSEVNGKVQVNVPVPVYCRPLFTATDFTQVN